MKLFWAQRECYITLGIFRTPMPSGRALTTLQFDGVRIDGRYDNSARKSERVFQLQLSADEARQLAMLLVSPEASHE